MQITTKYDVGQKVWINRVATFKDELQPVEQTETEIFAIMIWADGKPMYRCGMGNTRTESEIYQTRKEALADAKSYERKIRDIHEGDL